MNKADNIENKYACRKATRTSNKEINKAIGTDNPAQPVDLFKNIIENKAKMIMCPAVIFANKRIINAKGLVKIPTISIGIIIGSNASGTPGVAKICFQ